MDRHSNTDMLENTKLNFHNSVKNLTLKCVLYQNRDCDIWIKIISNLLTKEYYFNLNNLNILLQLIFDGSSLNKQLINCIFTLLKENLQLLKHQFNQLNIAFNIIRLFSDKRFYVLKWNSKIDEKFLNDFQQQCNEGCKQTLAKGEATEDNMCKEKYNAVLQQWVE